MNFNIALNTIIYIMVFLFPGLLFRKSYFSGKFSKQFGQGNLLERFLFTLLCGIVSLCTCGVIFYLINIKLELGLLHNVSFESISNVFENLSVSKYPQEFKKKDSLIEFGTLLLVIYAFSFFFGLIVHYAVVIFKLDIIIPTLRFTNDWQYLSKAKFDDGLKRNIGDDHITYVDILISHKDRQELYKGIIKDFIIDKDNKLEYIVIANASKFIPVEKLPENQDRIESLTALSDNNNEHYNANFSIHTNHKDKITFSKRIEGNRLVLPASNVTNINFKYVKVDNKLKFYQRVYLNVVNIVILMIAIALFIFVFIDIPDERFKSIWVKIVFSVMSFFNLLFITDIISEIPIKIKGFKKVFIEDIPLVIFFSIPYLWIFKVFTGVQIIVTLIAYPFILVFIMIIFKIKTQRINR